MLHYSKNTLDQLKTMAGIIKREQVDVNDPPEPLRYYSHDYVFMHYAKPTVKLLRWAIPIFAKHGFDVVNLQPDPQPRTHEVRTAEQAAFRARRAEQDKR